MTELAHADDGPRVLGGLNYLGVLLGLAAVAGILTAAMTMQYAFGELPCPLCLLQRVALFGFCFGTMLSFRWGFSWRNSGISLLCAVLLVVSVRQTLLDIYPRPGHAYIGSAVLGLHMPVWSVLIALALVFAQAVQLVLFGGRRVQHQPVTAFPAIEVAAKILGLFVVVLCAINFASVVLQCGLGECHTFGYELLSPAANP